MIRSRLRMLIAFLLLGISLSNCSSLRHSLGGHRDLSVFYFNLYNQQPQGLGDSRKGWAGDWLFRRERLLLVDKYLRDSNPDIVILQQMLQRRGSLAESDRHILGASGLKGYQWSLQFVREWPGTQEIEYHGLAAARPLYPTDLPEGVQHVWNLGKRGRVVFSLIEDAENSIPVFSVDVDGREELDSNDFFMLKSIVDEVLVRYQLCPLRVVIGGKLPINYASIGMQDFINHFGLQDVLAGYCATPSDCYTASPTNELFSAVWPNERGTQSSIFLVHESALVKSGEVVLKSPSENSQFESAHGVKKLWAAPLFGISSSLVLPVCSEGDI